MKQHTLWVWVKSKYALFSVSQMATKLPRDPSLTLEKKSQVLVSCGGVLHTDRLNSGHVRFRSCGLRTQILCDLLDSRAGTARFSLHFVHLRENDSKDFLVNTSWVHGAFRLLVVFCLWRNWAGGASLSCFFIVSLCCVWPCRFLMIGVRWWAKTAKTCEDVMCVSRSVTSVARYSSINPWNGESVGKRMENAVLVHGAQSVGFNVRLQKKVWKFKAQLSRRTPACFTHLSIPRSRLTARLRICVSIVPKGVCMHVHCGLRNPTLSDLSIAVWWLLLSITALLRRAFLKQRTSARVCWRIIFHTFSTHWPNEGFLDVSFTFSTLSRFHCFTGCRGRTGL